MAELVWAWPFCQLLDMLDKDFGVDWVRAS